MEGTTKRVSNVIGPDGSVLTRASLPPQNTRWIARRKAEIVIAVLGGILSLQEACERYKISNEEFVTWERAYAKLGQPGLRCRSHSREQFRRYRKRRKITEQAKEGVPIGDQSRSDAYSATFSPAVPSEPPSAVVHAGLEQERADSTYRS
jgi:hypothetical protein